MNPTALTTKQLNSYDYIIVAFSGGKDSQAMFLDLLERGVDKNKIELWHHIIDGREGSTLMDWFCTEDYCRQFAKAFNVPIYFSWKEGGFEREMLRENTPTAQNHFEFPSEEDDNIVECGLSGGKGTNGLRRKFPQVSADLSVRWCSAYLKIDVCTAAINNQMRFRNKKTLVLTGERAEESSARAKYTAFEPDRADRRNGKRVQRHVDHWRSVHAWTETEVWAIIERFGVLSHPAYRLGWGRLSCIACIFGSKNQFASLNALNPEQAQKIVNYENEFGVTIKRKLSVEELIATGVPYQMDEATMKQALSEEYYQPIITDNWTLPAGAFGESTGPS